MTTTEINPMTALIEEALAAQKHWPSLTDGSLEKSHDGEPASGVLTVRLSDTQCKDMQFINPFDGSTVTEVTRYRTVQFRLNAEGERKSQIVWAYAIWCPFGRTPGFVSLESLLNYCHVMRQTVRAPELQVTGTGMFSESNNPKHSPTFVYNAMGHCGLYAIVSETGYQLGPQDKANYAPYVREINRCFTPEDVEELHLRVEELNEKSDLPYRVERISVQLWSDATTKTEKVKLRNTEKDGWVKLYEGGVDVTVVELAEATVFTDRELRRMWSSNSEQNAWLHRNASVLAVHTMGYITREPAPLEEYLADFNARLSL